MTDEFERDEEEVDMDLTAPLPDDEEVDDLAVPLKDPLLEEDTEDIEDLIDAEEEEEEMDLDDDM